MKTSQLSMSDLVDGAAKLNVEDFEKFLKTVNMRRAQRFSDVLPEAEAALLKKIYRSFPKEKIARIELLNAKNLGGIFGGIRTCRAASTH